MVSGFGGLEAVFGLWDFGFRHVLIPGRGCVAVLVAETSFEANSLITEFATASRSLPPVGGAPWCLESVRIYGV